MLSSVSHIESTPSSIDSSSERYVYTVSDTGERPHLISSRIVKENDKCVSLETPLLLPECNHPKKLLIKGQDMIAYSEKEAVANYIKYLEELFEEMTKNQIRIKKLIKAASRLS